MIATPETSMTSPHTAPVRPGGLRRVPALDGLRGVAVAVVLVYHFFGDVMPGGYLGVDVFFVLSGFLITSLLIRERGATGRIDLPQFWVRRARRILPAAVVTLLLATAVAGFVGGDSAVGLGGQFLGTLFFVNNWQQIAVSSSYFADGGINVLAHYWSLAVEEQYYVVWPLIVAALFALGRGNRPLRIVAAVLGLASAAWMAVLYAPGEDPTRVYYGTDTHAFGLLVGALVAAWLTSQAPDDSWPAHRGPWRLVGTLSALVLVVLFVVLADDRGVTYRGGLLLASLATAGVVTAIVHGAGPVAVVLAWRPLRWLGERSFSLYLWHWPVIVIIRELWPGNAEQQPWVLMGLLATVISVPLADASYRWVETPVRRRGYTRIWRETFSAAVPAARKVAVPVVAAAMVAGAAAGVAAAPTQTKLEADLAAAGEAGEAGKADDVADVDHVFPDGDQITAIGDSVMLASKQALEDEFPGIYVDGDVSRHYEHLPAILEQMKAEGTLDPFVVLGFGTNGNSASGGDEELMDRITDILSPDRTVVFVLPYGDRWWMPAAEAEVLELARTHDNIYVADWCHAAKADPSRLRDDLIHPTPPGALAYVKAIRDALQQWVDGDKEIPGTCGV